MFNKKIVAAIALLSFCSLSSLVSAETFTSKLIGSTPGELGGYNSINGAVILVPDGTGFKGEGSFEIFDDLAVTGGYFSLQRDYSSRVDVTESSLSIGLEGNQKADFIPDLPSDLTLGIKADFYNFEVEVGDEKDSSSKTLLSLTGSFRSQLTEDIQTRVYSSVCLNCGGVAGRTSKGDTFRLAAGANYALSNKLHLTLDIDPTYDGLFGYIEAGVQFRLD